MKYELSMFLSPKMTDDEAEKKTKELDKILEKFEAKVLESNFLGMKDLAYQIKHFKQGYYFIAKIEVDPSKIQQIKFRVSDELDAVRLLVTKQEKEIRSEIELDGRKDEEKKGTEAVSAETEKKEVKVVKKIEVEKKEKSAFAKVPSDKEETDLDKKLDKILEEEIID